MATIVDVSKIQFSKFLYMDASGIIPSYTIMPYIKYKEGDSRIVIKNEYQGELFDDTLKNKISPTGTDWQFMLLSGYFTDNINRMLNLGVINLQPHTTNVTEMLQQYRFSEEYITSNLGQAKDFNFEAENEKKDFLYKGKGYDNWQYIPFYTYGDFESINDNVEYNYSINFDKTNCILTITKRNVDGSFVESKEYPFDIKVNHLYMLGNQVILKKSSSNMIDDFTSKLVVKNEDAAFPTPSFGGNATFLNKNLKCTKEQFNLFNNMFSIIESEHKWNIDSTPDTRWVEIRDNIDINENSSITWNAMNDMPMIIKKYLKPQSRKNHFLLKRNKDEIQYSSKYKMFPFYNKDYMSSDHMYYYEKDDYRTVNRRTGGNGENLFLAFYKYTTVIDLIYNENWNLFPWQSINKNKTADCYDTNNRIYYTGDKNWIKEGYGPYWNTDNRFADFKCGLWNSVKSKISLLRGYDFSKLEGYSNEYYTLNTNTITENDVNNVNNWSLTFSDKNILKIIQKSHIVDRDNKLIIDSKAKNLSYEIRKFINNKYYINGQPLPQQQLLTFLLYFCLLTDNLRQMCKIVCEQYNAARDIVFSRLNINQFYALMSTVYIYEGQDKIVDNFYYNENTKEAVECPYNILKPFTTCTYDKIHLCGSVYEFNINKKRLPLIEFVII